MVAQITFYLKLNFLRAVFEDFTFLQQTPKFGVHHIITQVSDVAQHARNAQTPLWNDALRIKMTAMKVGVGSDGTARNLVERDVLRVQVGRAGDDHSVSEAMGKLQTPTEGLHAAQAAAHDCRQLVNAQAVEQAGLSVHPIFHGHHREICSIYSARLRVDMHGARRAKTRS